MDKKIEVLLVDDHTIARNGVRLMLGTADDIAVQGEAADAQQAVELLKTRTFDVALLDITMPGKNGLELLKTLRSDWPKMAVLMLSTYSEEIYAVRALKLGAAGYLTKDVPTAVLIGAVRKAAAGGKHVSPALVEKLAMLIGGGGGMATHEELSNREFEVFKLIAAGESLVRIGELLHLSPNTVTTYRTRILEKMGMTTNADMTRYALEHGII
ncbi:DNA-binding NarL/FixJ family response regulator [Pseudoduganella flava]|uniref:Response regulator n=1 Tax=Pseudoduganella flava TaxID=871742 RepID=A0A562PQN9_9BURK|nr:response regulator transcription factor [Pseudoduganella flava]QGZ37927.1 response regulator [Pseudoduganella flava]TWI46764.1 DNA-binding NarL/FixJ family response regulator [Pseudoduganella flava]